MGLLTQDSIKSVENALHDAEVTLKHVTDSFLKSENERKDAVNSVQALLKDQENFITKIENDGNEELKLFFDARDQFIKHREQHAKIPYRFASKDISMANAHELYYEATIPFELLSNEAGREAYLKDFYDTYDDKYTAIRTKKDADLKVAMDKSYADGEPLEQNVDHIFDARSVVLNNEAKDLDAQISKADSAGDTDEVNRLKGLADKNKRSRQYLEEAREAIEDMFTEIRANYDTLTKAENEYVMASGVYNIVKSEIEIYVEKGENNPLLKQFEEEQKARKQHVEATVRNKERLMPLLKNKNTGLDNKMEEFTSDTNIFIEDIKTELGIDEAATTIIKQSIAELNEEYDKKGTEGVFTASKALELSRKSLFDLELAGINKLIKAACYKGETSIKLMESEITASQIIALNEGGYKITHASVSNAGRKLDDLFITIDWGFAAPTN